MNSTVFKRWSSGIQDVKNTAIIIMASFINFKMPLHLCSGFSHIQKVFRFWKKSNEVLIRKEPNFFTSCSQTSPTYSYGSDYSETSKEPGYAMTCFTYMAKLVSPVQVKPCFTMYSSQGNNILIVSL